MSQRAHDARPDDCAGWAQLSADLKHYERKRGDPRRREHAVRAQDVDVLEALLGQLRLRPPGWA